jgi:DNA-binding response OmpR family regulator
MDFSKSEENKLKLTVQRGDLVKFVHEEFLLFVEEAHRRQINYEFSSDLDRINAWFDPGKMEKIILNLISNAFKFTPDQGHICVNVRKVGIEKKEASPVDLIEFVKISVTDNGHGISQEFITKIFDRFFQSNELETKYPTGTGIGLALVKNLVELHHGSISVTSEKWKETCFMVMLPLGNCHFREDEIINEPIDIRSSILPTQYLPEQKKSQSRIPSNNTPVILIVEDNIELRDYIVSILSVGYQILEAPDGELGFEIAIEQIPDLIISDIIMPKMNGIEFCKKVKEEITTSHVPLILLTAKVTMEDTIEGIETGADAYITKPFNVNYLEVTIKKLIETRRKLFQRFSQEVFLLPKEISTNPLDQKFLERTIEYIDKNIENEEINVENLASHLAMNRSNLYRKIKALTGQTATEFIRTVRLKMAIKHMESGEMNVSEIAFKVGFSSPGYFAKCFKIQFGRTPSEYLSDRVAKSKEA